MISETLVWAWMVAEIFSYLWPLTIELAKIFLLWKIWRALVDWRLR